MIGNSCDTVSKVCSKKNTRKMLYPRREKGRKIPSMSHHIIEKTHHVSSCLCMSRKAHITHTLFTEHQVNHGNFEGLILRV